jgi:hypothetical protein
LGAREHASADGLSKTSPVKIHGTAGCSPTPIKRHPGTTGKGFAFICRGQKREERKMPILLLWAVPAVIVVGGAGYWLVHMH